MASVNDMTTNPPADVEIVEAVTRLRHAQCVQIRTRVFVVGQNVPAEREIDDFEDAGHHYLALARGVPSERSAHEFEVPTCHGRLA